jgi:predicted deacylase
MSAIFGVHAPHQEVRYSLESVLEPMRRITENSRHFVCRSDGRFDAQGRGEQLPRYLFVGPDGGGDTIRIGIFASIHGDEPEGAHAVVEFARELEEHPDLARGYALFLYPVCNPSGFIARTRHACNGKDLNREFWCQTLEPEVRFMESELKLHAFDGIITLHGDDTSDGLYGFVRGAVLSENLLEPALQAAEAYLPRNRGAVIDGFAARNGIITDGYPGMLQNVPGTRVAPFEITFETPEKAPQPLQVAAFAAALKTILREYRSLISIGANI